MDASVISALAALTGAAAGGTASFFASWISKQHQARVQWFTNDELRRQSLYKGFIEEASKCYVDAIQHHKPDIGVLVPLYAMTSEMRVVSSLQVLSAAEDVVGRLIDTYSKPDLALTDIELKTLVQDGSFDLLRHFSESCRAEFDLLHAQRLGI